MNNNLFPPFYYSDGMSIKDLTKLGQRYGLTRRQAKRKASQHLAKAKNFERRFSSLIRTTSATPAQDFLDKMKDKFNQPSPVDFVKAAGYLENLNKVLAQGGIPVGQRVSLGLDLALRSLQGSIADGIDPNELYVLGVSPSHGIKSSLTFNVLMDIENRKPEKDL